MKKIKYIIEKLFNFKKKLEKKINKKNIFINKNKLI